MWNQARSALLWAGFAALLIVATTARATTFILTDMPHLFAASDAVVLARVTDIWSVVADRELRTNIDLAVEEVVKGSAAVALSIVEPGGLVGEQRRWIHGAPTFFVGERVLLFLRRNARHEFETTFLGMGKFSVVRSTAGDEFAVRHVSDARVLTRNGRRLEAAAGVTSYTLKELLEMLRTREGAGVRMQEAPPVVQAEGSHWQRNFTFSGPPPVRWFLSDASQTIAYRISTGGDITLGESASVAAVDAALAAWSSVQCADLELADSGSGAPSSYSSCDGINEVTFNDPYSELGDPAGCSGTLAVGGVCADGAAPMTFNNTVFYPITEGDVVVNNGFGGCPFWTETNLAELITHEIGHTLGLGHSSEDPNEGDATLRDATMYYAAHFDGRGATLKSDDIAAICALYPAGDTGSAALRRFAIVSGPPGTVGRDRLVIDALLTLGNNQFHPNQDTMILEVLAAGASVFRLAVLPGTWLTDPDGTRFVFRGSTVAGTTTLLLMGPGPTALRLRASGLDLSAAQTEPLLLSLSLGAANMTEAVPPLRTSAHLQLYP